MKELRTQILEQLKGIDHCITDDTPIPGWWETSKGAEFGAEVIRKINRIFDLTERSITLDELGVEIVYFYMREDVEEPRDVDQALSRVGDRMEMCTIESGLDLAFIPDAIAHQCPQFDADRIVVFKVLK